MATAEIELTSPPRYSRLRPWLRRPAAMVIIGLVLRLAVLTIGHTYKVNPRDQNFGFGWETGRIAKSIAEGEGFSSPFRGDTGPTAWVAPLYPYLVAGVFKLLGIYSYASAWVLLAINSVFSALTCWTIYWFARATVGERTARWAGWTWALLPYAMYWAIRWVWETSLTAFLLSAAFLLALRLARSKAFVDWAGAGVLWGVIALANPSCLSLLPFCLGWPAWELYSAGRAESISRVPRPSPILARAGNLSRALLPLCIAGIMLLLSITPWLVRNYRAFGQFVFIRSNFGVELRLGNSKDAVGLWMFWFHPSQDLNEYARYAQMGEIAYSRARMHEALDFIRANPGRFAVLCIKRAVYFWAGTPKTAKWAINAEARTWGFIVSSELAIWGLLLVIKHRRPAWVLYAAAIIVYPLPYYLTFPHPRYRHPIEPFMVILGLYLLAQAIPPKPDPAALEETTVAA